MKLSKILWIAMLSGLVFYSCKKKDDGEKAPAKDVLTVTTDWSDIGTGLTPPAAYKAKLGAQFYDFTGNSNRIEDEGLKADSYNLILYTEPQDIAVSAATSVAVLAEAGDGSFKPMPGYLFASVNAGISFGGGVTKDVTAKMQQYTRDLTLTLKPQGASAADITAVTAELDGVASSWDIVTNKAIGAAVKVKPTFTKEGADYVATLRLLGVTGKTQKLSVVFTFANGQTFTLDTELSTKLTTFNVTKKTPLTLEAITTNTFTATGYSCTITDWVNVDREMTSNKN